MKRLAEGWNYLRKRAYRYPAMGLPAVFLGGVIFWGGFNWSLELTNTESFCISCHVMKEYVYKEYRKTGHYNNRTGVRASCPDCHVPREWVHKMLRKVAATNELFHWAAGTINTPAKFEAKRPELARQVWAGMKATDSRECRNCHGMNFMSHNAQTLRASTMHVLADKWDKTCIECHQGVAHALPRDFDSNALMDDLHDRMETEKIECQLCHKDMARPPAGEGWD